MFKRQQWVILENRHNEGYKNDNVCTKAVLYHTVRNFGVKS